MTKSVSDAYPTLWHYTTSAGLYGIIESQQLRASNYRYLNDEEEVRGFFDRKLPALLEAGIADGIVQLSKTAHGQGVIKEFGGANRLGDHCFQDLFSALRRVALDLDFYFVSFCYTSPGLDSQDGLLSQWRGYGPDGGYALVFDTKGLEDLLRQEGRRFTYPFLRLGDVDYHDEELSVPNGKHQETLEWEASLRKVISTAVATRSYDEDATAELFDPVMSLSTRHKHRGFREEREVRVAAMLPTREMVEADRKAGNRVVEKPVSFFPRNGILVPYIALFEGIAGDKPILPIREVVIGPHPEKLKRQRAVQLFLDQHGIEATVRVSDIPYLGR